VQTFWKLFARITHYRGLVTGNIVFNVLVALFTVVSIPAIIPFFKILFQQVDPVTEVAELQLHADSVVEWSKYQYSSLIIEKGSQTALLYICGILVALFFFKNLFRYLSLACLVPVRNNVIKDLRQALYEKILSLPMGYFSNEKKGDLIARFSTDVLEIEHSILNVVEVMVKSPLIIIGCISFMLYVSPSLTLFVFVLIIFTAIIIGGISRTLKRTSRQAQNRLGEIVSTVDETISGLKIIKSFGAETFFKQQFDHQNTQFKNLLNKILWRRDLSSPLSEFLGIATVAVLLWYGSKQVFAQDLDPSTFFAFIFAFFSVIEPAKSFAKAYYDIQKGMAAADRVQGVLDEGLVIEDDPMARSVDRINEGMRLENVSFRYEEHDNEVLKEVTMSVPVGKVIALVGASGSGKTTIVDLINRFYDVSHGRITLDGIDIRKLKLTDLRSMTSIVSQDPVVFNDTIYNNITFGLTNISPEQVEEAAKAAHAHDFIMDTELQYQATVGDSGVKLSGGQRQRITLARAILKNAPLLILDEATSALDSESEKEVQLALQSILKDRTVIIIAHRLSTIQHADIIYVMKSGKVIETGNHEDLINSNGEYKKFVELQAF